MKTSTLTHDPASRSGTMVTPTARLEGLKNYVVFADETGTAGGEYYGFGSLWMPWDRLEEFEAEVCRLRRRHRYVDPIRWAKADAAAAFLAELVDFFFRERWMMFHMLVVREVDVAMELHQNDRRLARRRHFAMFLRKKLADFGRTRDKAYHVVVQPAAWMSTPDLRQRVNRRLDVDVGSQCLASVTERSIADSPGIGLSDVFVGAVMAARSGELLAPGGAMVSSAIASALGWPDLAADTFPTVDKFNIWRFWDGTESRYETTRRVTLKYPAGTLVRR